MRSKDQRERRHHRRRGVDRDLQSRYQGTIRYGHPGRRRDDRIVPESDEPYALLLDQGFGVCAECEALIAEGTYCDDCEKAQSVSSV